MKIAKVTGCLWASKKETALEGVKLVVVREYDPQTETLGSTSVAADHIGAGIGEIVLLVDGGAARYIANHDKFIPIDRSVCAIVDEIELKD